ARPAAPTRVVQGARIPDDLAETLRRARGALSSADARRLLEAYGVRFCRERTATTVDEAIAAAEAIGHPVVLKADAPGLTHKTDAGGVVLDVRDGAGVRTAWRELRARTGATRVVVQERIARGVELLVGAHRDD